MAVTFGEGLGNSTRTVTVKELREALAAYPDDAEVIIATVPEGMVHLEGVSPHVASNGDAVQLNSTCFVEECL